MRIRMIGALRTIEEWEDLLETLPDPARGPEGLGRFSEEEKPPRLEGQDPTMTQGWRLAVVRGVEVLLPADAEVISTRHETVGEYQFVLVHGVRVHLRDGLTLVDGKVVVDVHVCVRVFWPKGAEARQPTDPAQSTKPPYRNYRLFVDVFPTEEDVTQELVVHPPGTERKPVLMFGSKENVADAERGATQATCWATRSFNWRPQRGDHPGTGSDQCVCFYRK